MKAMCAIHGVRGNPCPVCAAAWAITDAEIRERIQRTRNGSAAHREKLAAQASKQIAEGRCVQPRAKSMPPATESFRNKRAE